MLKQFTKYVLQSIEVTVYTNDMKLLPRRCI